MIDKNLCDLVKSVRKQVSKDPKTGDSLSQTAFAKSLQVSQGNIADIENYKREPSKMIIKKIIDVYKINLLSDDIKLLEQKAISEALSKELDRSFENVQNLQKMYLGLKEAKPKENASQDIIFSYQLQQQNAEIDSLRKENERLKQENLRLFTELQIAKSKH